MTNIHSELPQSLRIGIIRGGTSSEYDASIKSGANMLKHLSGTHNPIDIFIDKKGDWYVQGVKKTPENILKTVDVVINTLHGFFGEDGGIQEILGRFGARFAGTGKYHSSVAMNRGLVKDQMVLYDIKTPAHVLVRKKDDLAKRSKEIWSLIPQPMVLKPAKGGSAYGYAVVENFEDFQGVLKALLNNHDSVVVEEFIPGISASCMVLEDFRGQKFYAFPPSVELRSQETKVVEEMAKAVHALLELKHYSQSDFIISPRRGVYFLEVNTSPKLGEKSLAIKALEKVGVSAKEFLHHLTKLALNKKI
jgi:D-alanine-D-alanine ligase